MAPSTQPIEKLQNQATQPEGHPVGRSPTSVLTARPKVTQLSLPAAPPTKPRAAFFIFPALFQHVDIMMEVSQYLDVDTLVSLYAISRDFHALVSARMSTTLLSHARFHAPESASTFLFKAYKKLCVPDPAQRPHPVQAEEVRLVPSFRWLRMVLYREEVVRDIIRLLAREEHRLPPRASLTLKRMWLTMDISTNAKRVGLMHNHAFWTNEDLRVATMFFMKLDMRFMDPVESDGENALRKLVMAQRSLAFVRGVLDRSMLTTHTHLLAMHVRHGYRPSPDLSHYSILGVPADQVGRGELENRGEGPAILLRPDELVMQEAIRRGIQMEALYLDMMLYGFIDLTTFEDILPTPEELDMEREMKWGDGHPATVAAGSGTGAGAEDPMDLS
ncbi:MAG: hypothetical protein M1838_003658 [Thelocarpon superellum]|nr:MAG: hypothetical protein M1838_003658 [Thelocarpon superellum]